MLSPLFLSFKGATKRIYALGHRKVNRKVSRPDTAPKARVNPKPKVIANEIRSPANPGREWLRELFREHKEGLTPAQIREFALVDSLEFNESFPYTSLWKLKSRGELTERGGKYFLASNENAAVQ